MPSVDHLCSTTCSLAILLASSGAMAGAGDGVGTFVWFDSAIWSVPGNDWQSSLSDCWDSNNHVLRPGGGTSPVFADADGLGFKNLRALMQDDTAIAPMPAGATLNNGNTFLIATSLDPTGLDEFWTEDYVVSNQTPLTMGNCLSSTDPHDQFHEAQQIAYKAFHAAVKGLLNPDSGDPVPLSLMFSSFRSLRFGRILSEQHHQDTTYGDSTWFGGLTKMNAQHDDPRLEVTNNKEESDLGNGAWSTKWPNNATMSPVDDVQIAVNYVKRCIEFANYCNDKGDLGTDPVIDVYLDLELFQLSHVAPSGDSSLGVGAMYPGIDEMPATCLEQAGILDDKGRPQSYWVVPASAADAFWRTLQWCRGLIDDYNTSRSTGDCCC